MAHPCVSTSAASLRLNPLAFSSANPSSCLETKTISLFPFQSLGSRNLRKIAGNQKNFLKFSVKAMYPNEFGKSARLGDWAMGDKVQIPSFPDFQAVAQPQRPQQAQQASRASRGQGQGLSPVVEMRFQNVINQLFQHRIIRCGGSMEDDLANVIVAQLLYLDAIDPKKDIVMYVNCPGGSVTAGMAIFDTMRHIRPDVSTVCVGCAASMGAFLLSAGTKGKRFSLPHSRIMIHQPSGGTQGTERDTVIQVNEMLHHKANMASYLAYHTGQSLEKINRDTRIDFFMSAKEAQEYGLIDGIISNPEKALQPLVAIAEQ